MLIIGLVLIGYAGLHILDWYSHTQGIARLPNPVHIVTSSSKTPDERPVPKDASYVVPANQPKKISISAIGVEGFIQQVGTTRSHEIGTPENVNYAGWYLDSAKPGDDGISVIVGHVSSRYGSAIFAKLNLVKAGDVITVEYGDDSLRTFEAVQKFELPKDQAGRLLKQQSDGIKQQLDLITCGGTYDKQLHQYNNRIVVVAKRIN